MTKSVYSDLLSATHFQCYKKFQTTSSLLILVMSLIKSRLDIPNLLSTSQKQLPCDSMAGFFFVKHSSMGSSRTK